MRIERVFPRPRLSRALRCAAGLSLILAAACGSDSTSPPPVSGFLAGTADNHQIGLVVDATGKALTLFQLGSPTTQVHIPLGTSSTVTPIGFSTSGRHAAVPLGNAASVALIDLETQAIERFYTFAIGNATGSAFSDDTTLFVANTDADVVGRMTTGQAGDAIPTLVAVAPAPTAITVAAGRVLVTSGNLDESFTPIGNGVVTAIDPRTMQVVGTATMGGTNSGGSAIGPDGLLYVVNTGDYQVDGSLTIVDPSTMQVVTTVGGMGIGPGAISIDANGLAYISSASGGTIVWSTRTRTFVRGPDNPVCAQVAGGACRGAFAAEADGSGTLYQLFFGSAPDNQPPYAFVYQAGSFTLTDSISVGTGPAAIHIRTF